MKKQIIDGNTACSIAAYKLSEISFIYPITPSSPMAENFDELASKSNKNIFGNVVNISEMQSEAGVAGAMHGACLNGCLSTTFTSSQGLLLMIPNMYKIAGEMLPNVINVASRSIASHALNIFCDHSDVMSARGTGYSMLFSSNPQETYDFTVASFISTIKTRTPFLNIFDGFRTSHQISNVNILDDDELRAIFPYEKMREYKSRSLSPNSPKQYGTSEGDDIFFQGREKSNNVYKALPNDLENVFKQIQSINGNEHHIMEYYGSTNAKYVIVLMGSSCDTVKTYIDYVKDPEIGLIKINLYRPFSSNYFIKLLPTSIKTICVLDRVKEQGSIGEPLLQDMCECVLENSISAKVIGGRYGLGGKEFTPAMVKSVFENLKSSSPKNHFTIGINDDLSQTSLNFDENFNIIDKSFNALLYGLGSDGTVSSSKNIAKILGNETNNFIQEYAKYGSKKSGDITQSFLTISPAQFSHPYLCKNNDIIVVSNQTFLQKYEVVNYLKTNGTLLINSNFKNESDFSLYTPYALRKNLYEKSIRIFSIDASKIALENDIPGKISTIMQMAFFYVTKLIDFKLAKNKVIEAIKSTYAKKGETVVNNNINAISDIEKLIVEIPNTKLQDHQSEKAIRTKSDNKYIDEYLSPILNLSGNDLPVSKINLFGENQTSTSQFEKRNISTILPSWDKEKCIECGKCTMVCPHASIRAKLLTDEQLANGPKTLQTKKFNLNNKFNYSIEISPKDCTGCSICSNACPVKAIIMKEKESILNIENQNYEYTKDINNNNLNLPLSTFSAQFLKPYFEFSGACAGCGETPYIKLLTQLYGNNLTIANATGCSSIYGGSAPSCPYSKDKNDQGPAWANSLFEDNAEFGFGIKKSENTKRNNLINYVTNNLNNFPNDLKNYLSEWLKNLNNKIICNSIYLTLKNNAKELNTNMYTNHIFNNLDSITTKSIWVVGGDGWAYDIGFGGLDHILNSKEKINILVLDTEVYSNTGGQMSKSTPLNAIAKFCSNGKKTPKKNLGFLALTYKNVYVAQVCIGANIEQTLKAFKEAEEYEGPSIIIAYCPCINHGINMSNNIDTEKDAVSSGYWTLYRYNPTLSKLTIDSAAPHSSLSEHLKKERRFANFFEKEGMNKNCFSENDKKSLKEYEDLLSIQKLINK